MRLTNERKGQIALILVKDRFRNDGLRLKPDMTRQIYSDASRLGIPGIEMVQFAEELVRELVEEVFPPSTTSHHNPEYTKGM